MGCFYCGYFVFVIKMVQFFVVGCELMVFFVDIYGFFDNFKVFFELVMYWVEFYCYIIFIFFGVVGVLIEKFKIVFGLLY